MCVSILYVAIFTLFGTEAASDPWAIVRERMVQTQIEQRGVRNRRVLDTMRAVPRHVFVPEAFRSEAYADHPLAIGYGQTISQPYVVALMTELLEPGPADKVLEIGTGSGYQAAVLARMARRVYSIEIVPELARSAAARLKQYGFDNVTVRVGDGYHGWPEEAPFDRIVLTAAPPFVPPALVRQLKNGGVLVAPEGLSPFDQQLVIIRKALDGQISRRSVLPVRFVPMLH